MRRPFPAALLLLVAIGPQLSAQDAARAAETANQPKPPEVPSLSATQNNGQPITTEIYADEASFNTEKRVGVFKGHVRVFDPRFLIQSDKLTVFIHKEEGEGLEKAIAEDHVGVVREKPDPKGGPPSKAIGLSDKAVYTSSDGNVVLTGTPRVQQGLDTHISTSPDTVMILNQDGQLTTHGPSRTEIRQEPSPSPAKPGVSPSPAKPGASPTPTPSPSPAKKKKR
jgi:lipopolysaccharide transport protein LptA